MREYLLVLLVAASVTYLLTPVARRVAVRLGAMAEPRDRDVHAIPTPRLGGLAMYGGIVRGDARGPRSCRRCSQVFRYSDVQAVLVAGGVIVLVGVVDDTLGAGRAHQARRPGGRRRRHGAARACSCSR